ncbi:MAG: 2-phosphosulfolactate phosphatase [Nocardioides sp.]
MPTPGHDQADHRIRLEWGPTGGAVVARRADIAVVVDVLSFSTTVTVAVERGITVFPYRWRDARAAEYAEELDANLALQRQDARYRAGAVSLSPGSLQTATGIERLVLPSPNGSTICAELAGSGAEVVVACLRNARAVADWLRPRLEGGAVVAVVPAGERWRDGSMRPCAEDLWGAGAVLADLDPALMSPEARLARDAYAAFEPRPLAHLAGCAGGVELAAAGFAHDVAIAGRLHTSDVVPVLRDGAFMPAP